MDALKTLIESTPGKQAGFAASLGITQSAVSQWGGTAPLQHCPAIEKQYGAKCEVLRPDVTWIRDKDGAITGYHVPLAVA